MACPPPLFAPRGRYETLLLEDRRLRSVAWSSVVVDEAHKLKNANSKSRIIVDSLEYEHLALLTGTPMQNNASELWSLLNLLDPSAFDDPDAFERKVGGKAASTLQGVLAPYMLRRIKVRYSPRTAAPDPCTWPPWTCLRQDCFTFAYGLLRPPPPPLTDFYPPIHSRTCSATRSPRRRRLFSPSSSPPRRRRSTAACSRRMPHR